MLMRDDPLVNADESQAIIATDSLLKAAFHHQGEDGYRYLDALGNDLSLEDTPLVDMEDLLLS